MSRAQHSGAPDARIDQAMHSMIKFFVLDGLLR
jgi:hypothetical protein